MKLVKHAGTEKLELTKEDWITIGKQTGWLKQKAQSTDTPSGPKTIKCKLELHSSDEDYGDGHSYGNANPTPEQIRMAFNKVLNGYGGKSAIMINNGHCYPFADKLAWELKTGTLYRNSWDDDLPDHTFLKVGNLYYDAETPNGAANWLELGFYKRFLEKMKNVYGEINIVQL